MSGTHGGSITLSLCRLISLRAHRGTNYPSRMDFRLRSISTVKCNDRRRYIQRVRLESIIVGQLLASLRWFLRDRIDRNR